MRKEITKCITINPKRTQMSKFHGNPFSGYQDIFTQNDKCQPHGVKGKAGDHQTHEDSSSKKHECTKLFAKPSSRC